MYCLSLKRTMLQLILLFGIYQIIDSHCYQHQMKLKCLWITRNHGFLQIINVADVKLPSVYNQFKYYNTNNLVYNIIIKSQVVIYISAVPKKICHLWWCMLQKTVFFLLMPEVTRFMRRKKHTSRLQTFCINFLVSYLVLKSPPCYF